MMKLGIKVHEFNFFIKFFIIDKNEPFGHHVNVLQNKLTGWSELSFYSNEGTAFETCLLRNTFVNPQKGPTISLAHFSEY